MKIFYGWFIVLAGFIITFAGMGVVNSMSGPLLVPITEELAFSRGAFTFHRTILFLLGALFMPLYGRLFERIGVKKVLLVSTVAAAILIFTFGFATELWHFYVLAAINSLVVSGPSFMSVGYMISRWFDAKRGFVTGLAFAGFGVGTTIFIPVATWLESMMGWQAVYHIIGIIVFVVVFPTVLFLVKDKPEDMGLEPYQGKAGVDKPKNHLINISFKDAMKTPIFWMLLIGFFLLAIMQGAPNFNAQAYLTDIGYTPDFAAMVMVVLMLAHTLGSLTLGGFFDKFGMMAGGLFLGIACIIFPMLAIFAEIPVFLWLFALLYGPASSGFVPVALFVTFYFGGKDFALIFSVFNMVMQMAMAISGPVLAVIYDFSGSYFWGWIMLAGFGVVITICLSVANFLNNKQLHCDKV
ncbi:MAG: MFS transporter [Defluviitaleaceae bacterium]|nr:MFS transporter [Defluviitaleaceae bacterium]